MARSTGRTTPQKIDELKAIQSEIKARRKTAHKSLTEWDESGIDFDDFHPDARSVLDDPRLWDVCDDWAPNGNDTGADVLELYRDWRKRNRKTKAETFFKQLMQGWEVKVPPDPSDEYSAPHVPSGHCGLAFAQLKLHAKCDPPIALLALQTLEAQPEHGLTDKLKSVLQRYA